MPIELTSVEGLPTVKSLKGVSELSIFTLEDLEASHKEYEKPAKYKIEIIFSRHRSSRSHIPSPFMLLIWESGKRLHGGGDQKMYWCGYDDCQKPISSDNFGYAHVVCPKCDREQFLDLASKQQHIAMMHLENQNSTGIKNMPIVIGERLANLTPPKLAELLEKTWHSLDGDADIYLKYSPYEIHYDPKEESTKTIDNLHNVRVQRKPLIYTLRAIVKDLSAGAGLRKRLQAMITS